MHTNVPTDILPDDLKIDLPKGTRVNVTIESEDEPIPGYSRKEVEALLNDCGQGDPIRFETRAAFREHLSRKLDAARSRQKKSA